MNFRERAEAARGFPGFEESTPALRAPTPEAAAFLRSGSGMGESLRSLAARLRLISKERPIRCMAVVSAVPAEGKTLVSLGLASAWSRASERPALLIGSDIRQRQLDRYLGLPPMPGLAEWLEGDNHPLPVRRVRPSDLCLLSAGERPCAPELLGSPRMAALVEAASERYDLVILDCAPLVPVADTLGLQGVVDGFLFVVRSRHCPRRTVERALALLNHDKVLGFVFNDERHLLPTQEGYGYGYGYGGYGRHEAEPGTYGPPGMVR